MQYASVVFLWILMLVILHLNFSFWINKVCLSPYTTFTPVFMISRLEKSIFTVCVCVRERDAVQSSELLRGSVSVSI